MYVLRVVLYVLRVHESPFFSKFAARNTPDNISPNLYNIFESSHHTLYLSFNLTFMKKLLKLTLLLLASIVLAVPLRAANNPVTLVVLTRDNAQHMFVLADKPEVTFEGTDSPCPT